MNNLSADIKGKAALGYCSEEVNMLMVLCKELQKERYNTEGRKNKTLITSMFKLSKEPMKKKHEVKVDKIIQNH